MAKTHQRVFALVAALLFLATTVAFSAIVVWQMRQDSAQPEQPEVTQTPTEETCQIDEVAGEVKAVPEVFKPSSDVTKLEVTDLKVGDGQTVQAGDCVSVKYHGTLATNGEKFDGNFDQPKLLRMPIGVGSVIKGWDQGVVGMKVGGVRRLVIPSELAYGEQGGGTIPANSDLVFVVEVVSLTTP